MRVKIQRIPHGSGGCNRPAPGELGQTLSKECGATCCPGCRKTRTLRPSALLNRLKSAHPDRCSDTHLWTLWRGVQQWRGIMAEKLVYATAGEPMAEPAAMPELALVGRSPGAKVSVTFLNEATGTGKYG